MLSKISFTLFNNAWLSILFVCKCILAPLSWPQNSLSWASCSSWCIRTSMPTFLLCRIRLYTMQHKVVTMRKKMDIKFAFMQQFSNCLLDFTKWVFNNNLALALLFVIMYTTLLKLYTIHTCIVLMQNHEPWKQGATLVANEIRPNVILRTLIKIE
jgi:hypothetical protein